MSTDANEVVSNIDELLGGGLSSSIPDSPEQKQESTHENDEYNNDLPEQHAEKSIDDPYENEKNEETKTDVEPDDADDYGNPKQKARTYTEDEVNERINKAVRDRLSRLERNNEQPSQQQAVQQAQQEFQYNPDSELSWQQQLESLVEQTITKMSTRQAQQQQRQAEMAEQREFETKFQEGMSRFPDFVEVVSNQPITDAMTIATRGIDNPAAFIYAASKRAPQELARISALKDPVKQMVEMGKLEERMRKNKPSTKAPRPLSRTSEDAPIPHKSDKEPTIEQMIANAEASKLAKLKARRK